MYEIDNKYQKGKIKNIEQRLDFQKYNIKEKKKKEREGKKKKRTTRFIKKQQQPQKEYILRFSLKIGSFFFGK